MKAEFGSKFLLKKMLDEFKPSLEGLSKENIEYLEQQLKYLNGMAAAYKEQSRNPAVLSRHRARARDLEQNAIGLMAGIKFSLSLLLYNDYELHLENQGK